MNKIDREKIDRSVDAIMKILDMTILWPYLLEYQIYNELDVNVPRWKQSLNDKKTMKEILLTIKTRGPHAYQNLIRSLKESEYTNIINILENSSLPSSNNNNCEMSDIPVEPYRFNEDILSTVYNPSKATEPLKVLVRKSTKFLDRVENQTIGRYPMRSKVRGFVLIITLIDYKGTNTNRSTGELDEKNLKELFEQMGFTVFSYIDLTIEEIKETLKNFSRDKNFRNVHSCFVIISGHGTRSKSEAQTVIVDYKNKEITVGEILTYFSAEKCLQLSNKPKIFIFQTCRGALEQTSKTIKNAGLMTEKKHSLFALDDDEFLLTPFIGSQHPANTSVRNYADILVAHSTLPCYVSNRDLITGTWYVQLLCSIFMQHAHQFHIHDLFLMIDSSLERLRDGAEHCQTSTVKTIGFNKHLYINPGLFEDS